ncbi:hypothetical protein Dsin_025282 [Dipteronia sinensis]|uniref:Flavin-containing monooxygenase n=1 Tax=Dipteronia sinensis TaxID=43782 RepID=A0AAD9ZVJ8_9ROSI|nr:hypothetical protein Dsin_025282 [Dipteronia sinensis]
MEEQAVIIVGSGPSGLATAACLHRHSIPYTILEREDCFASLWKKYSYDRLHLHLVKHFCELPHMSFPPPYPRYVSKNQFIQYLDDYVSRFDINPLYGRSVESAEYDEACKRWTVKARNVTGTSGDQTEEEVYFGRFLVVASGETSDPFMPDIDGLSRSTTIATEIDIRGLLLNQPKVIHSTQFRNGKAYSGKNVLVVGSGNSGMEIALDLANNGAKTSIVIRSPVHVLSREIVYIGLVMMKYFPAGMVDSLMVMLSKLVYGDLTKYGIVRPTEGPFFMKVAYGKYPIFDIGTCNKIKSGEIQVLPAIESIRGNEVVFKNGNSYPFDTIIFCTGFKRSTHKWLKDDDYLLNDDGIPKQSFPNHWKGKKGLYCVGLSRRGLYGASADAQNIANHIKNSLL